MLRRQTNDVESAAYLPDLDNKREKRQNYSVISSDSRRISRDKFDLNDIDGARPEPISYIMK